MAISGQSKHAEMSHRAQQTNHNWTCTYTAENCTSSMRLTNSSMLCSSSNMILVPLASGPPNQHSSVSEAIEGSCVVRHRQCTCGVPPQKWCLAGVARNWQAPRRAHRGVPIRVCVLSSRYHEAPNNVPDAPEDGSKHNQVLQKRSQGRHTSRCRPPPRSFAGPALHRILGSRRPGLTRGGHAVAFASSAAFPFSAYLHH